MKILLIEDDKDLIETLKELLEQEGYFIDYFICLDEMDDYIILNKYDLKIRPYWSLVAVAILLLIQLIRILIEKKKK